MEKLEIDPDFETIVPTKFEECFTRIVSARDLIARRDNFTRGKFRGICLCKRRIYIRLNRVYLSSITVERIDQDEYVIFIESFFPSVLFILEYISS